MTKFAISGMAAALMLSTASIALADDATKTGSDMAMNGWGCTSTVSTAASSGPGAGTGLANDQTGRETSSGSGSGEVAAAAPSAAASGAAVDTGAGTDVSGTEAGTTASSSTTTEAAPSAAASGAAVDTGAGTDVSGREADSSTSAVGRSHGSFDQAALQKMLSDQGYSTVNDISCENGAWTFTGTQNGSSGHMRVNPDSGTIESR